MTIDPRTARILQYAARDIESLLLPELQSERARFAASAIKSLLEAAVAGQAARPAIAATGAALKDVLAQEVAALPQAGGARDAAYEQSGSGVNAADAGDGPAPIPPITAQTLAPYLAARGDYGWVEDVAVKQAPGGFSKETYLVALTGADGRSEEIVLRRDPVFSPLGSTVAAERPILDTLAGLGLGLPLPQVLWLETDPAAFGAAVIAVSRLGGSADVSRWTGDAGLAREVVGQAAALLARLHQGDVVAACAPEPLIPGSDGATPAAMVADLRGFWTRLGYDGDALVEGVFDWLEAHAPAAFAARALLHGDFGFHNLLIEDGRLTGLLDWEFCHTGDVAEDLAYARPFVEKVIAWDAFVGLYREAGGPEVPGAAIDFWQVFGLLRIGLGCVASLRAIDDGNPQLDAKAAYVAQTFARPFLIDAARFALAATQP